VIELLSGPTAGIEHGQASRADYTDALLTVGLLLVFPIWICAHLLSASLSRAREFAADRSAAAITGDPTALAAALQKIDSDLEARPRTDFRESEIAAFAIVEPSRGEYDGVGAGVQRRIQTVFATHPRTSTRLDRLCELVDAQERN
jgi:heat shock protein HtpX